MAGKGVMYGGGDALNQTKSSCLDYAFASAPSNPFLGSGGMVSFGPVSRVKRSGSSIFGCFEQDESGDEYFDEYFNQPEKKRRLSVDQIQFLEKSFEADNKLEPDRKVQLAKELGLPPRQIAIWFQNRRARWKNKQIETDYDTLHSSYESLKTRYDNLLKENQELKEEVLHLKQNGLAKGINKASSELEATSKQLATDTISEAEESQVAFKNEDLSSAKSDVTDANSPGFADRNYISLLESGDNSHVLEHDQPNLLQNGEDNLNEELLQPAYIFHSVEDSYRHQPANSNSYGFQVDDHAYGFWSY